MNKLCNVHGAQMSSAKKCLKTFSWRFIVKVDLKRNDLSLNSEYFLTWTMKFPSKTLWNFSTSLKYQPRNFCEWKNDAVRNSKSLPFLLWEHTWRVRSSSPNVPGSEWIKKVKAHHYPLLPTFMLEKFQSRNKSFRM